MTRTRIAFVTDDGATISAHFGRATHYEICTIEGNTVTQRERVPKVGHHSSGAHGTGGHEHHGHDHGDMISPIRECTILVARGMGMGAHTALQALGITPILTDEPTIDAALQKFIAGNLSNNARRLHDHGPGHGH